tara:strand:+ start:35975 stop:37201 length:1227 start_codon:yes stop_codon:yes gene_type:complete
MPLPSPNKGQKKEEFVNICMDNTKMLNEFPDDKQRAAVCYSQWDKSNGSVEMDFSGQYVQAKEGKTLNKPFRTPKGPKKFSVYVKNEKGNVVKVNFGDPNMEIKRDDPKRRKNFRARHNCENPGPKTKARYWSCKMWSKKSVTKMTKGSEDCEWDGETFFDHDELLTLNPSLAFVETEITENDDICECEPNEATLAKKEKTLPPALQKQILKKKGKKKEENSKEEEEKAENKSKADEDDKVVLPYLRQKKTADAYEMSYNEYNQVMNFNDAVETRDDLPVEDLEEAISAKRRGPKSSAQTPAKPSERKKGSSKNKKGSAGKSGPAITFSAKVTESLKNKVKEHNSKYPKKVTLSQLKKVYRRGAGAFSSSHRPGKTRGQWAMARVNMFLKMKAGKKVKDSYRAADGDI